MVIGAKISTNDKVQSYLAWWQLAGLHSDSADQPQNWLADAHQHSMKAQLAEAPSKNPAMPMARTAPAQLVQAQLEQADWPKTAEQLRLMVAEGAALPGMSYSQHRAAPTGSGDSKLMIFIDFPEESDVMTAALGQEKMLIAMIRAIGLAPEQCFFAALAYSRPHTATIAAEDLASLKEFAMHQIALVNPDAMLFLGSTVSEALLSMELPEARKNIQFVNHNDCNKAVVTTYHPRTLAKRPALKAQAWHDLRMLIRKDNK